MRLFRGFTIAISLALCACAPGQSAIGGLPAAPAELADGTTLDEQTALGIELAYQAAAFAVLTATDAGLIRGPVADQVAACDRAAHSAVVALRSAYDAGNARSYSDAAKIARKAVAALLAAQTGECIR